ncbi:MAG TPA: chemotaxis protein CheW [Bryobacteraceae bacterium]|nr:chemotaxis protein CheW [Bryobacteraceae bacterium]
MTNLDDDIVREYLDECREHLSGIESDLLQMEQDGAEIDEERVNRVFRAAHSIKGGAGFFNFTRIRDLAHKTENVLDLIRSRRATASPEVVNILLMSFDKLHEMVDDPSAGEQTDTFDFVRGLEALAAASLPPEEQSSVNRNIGVSPGTGIRATVTEFDFDRARKSGKTVYLIEYDLLHDVQRKGRKPLDVLKNLMQYGMLLASAFHIEAAGTLEEEPTNALPLDILYASSLDTDLIGTAAGVPEERIWKVDRSGVCHPMKEPAPGAGAAEVPSAVVAPAPAPAPEEARALKEDAGPAAAGAGDSTVRLNVAVLDSLMNLAGELVLCRNQLGEAVARRDEAAIEAASQSISVVTSEVQQAVMRTRMQPVANLFQKFTRTVRDTARKLGKEVRLVMEANEVELDKTILEGLSDPLAHMVRNAVDHGIEAPASREASGKAAEGTVFLRAWHEAGLVVVEVADDGRGLDPEKLASAAVAKGVLSAEAAQRMTHEEKLDLILLPGFSTAQRITDISGRGVGMDVVKTNLDRLGGKLEIHSAAGRGSSFRIKLPLTLAIIPSLLVSAGDERVAVPLVNVQKLMRIAAGDRSGKIERVGNSQVLVLEDELLPLVYLRRSLDVAGAAEPENAAMNIVLVNGGGYRYGLVVDELHDTIEIVVKPLGQRLKHLQQHAGATILGDGCVALILDVSGVASAAALVRAGGLSQAAEAPAGAAAESHHFLLVHNSAQEIGALPLNAVERVEKIRPEQVEFIGHRRSMQYRGRSLPLVALADTARVSELPLDENLIVVVLELAGRSLGLLAARPVDVIEAELEIDGTTFRQPGIMGSAILRGRTTLILDPFELAQSALPEAPGGRDPQRTAPTAGATILFAEDSTFFREYTTRLLEDAGYGVKAAADGEEAWDLLQKDAAEIRLVLSDVEMPRLDGLELTRKIRADGRLAHLPVILLSSLAGDEDIQRGEAAGATRYCIKLDREQVLGSIRDALAPPGREGMNGLVELSRQIGETGAEPATCGLSPRGQEK